MTDQDAAFEKLWEDSTSWQCSEKERMKLTWDAALASRITGPSDEEIETEAAHWQLDHPEYASSSYPFYRGAKWALSNLRISAPKLAWEDVEKLFPKTDIAWMEWLKLETHGWQHMDDFLNWLHDEMKRRINKKGELL